jgi:putative tryptophan/tyrosine transport system substrate-binding protein
MLDVRCGLRARRFSPPPALNGEEGPKLQANMTRQRFAPTRRALLRSALTLAGLGLLSGCGIASRFKQQRARVPVIGFLATGSREGRAHLIAGFLEGLRELGYVEGRDIAIEYRFGDGSDQLLALATGLVQLQVDIIFASAAPASFAAQRATSTIPIVLGAAGEPVATGLVASLARPGGNITGMGLMSAQAMGKRLELLNETLRGVSRLAVISVETNPLHVPQDRDIQDAARPLGIQVHIMSVRGPDDLEGTLEAATSARADAIYGPTDSVITNARARLAELALRLRLPSLFDYRDNVDAGGLLSYGPNLVDTYRRAATYVDSILKGAKPADLPVQQPTKLDLVINLRTAQALGLTIPQSVLQQATEIIQ